MSFVKERGKERKEERIEEEVNEYDNATARVESEDNIESEKLKKDTNIDSKIIIDEDSSDNQFKLEL